MTTYTGTYGSTSVTFTAPSYATAVTITASFAGDNVYRSSSATSTGTISAENATTAISFSPPHSDSGSDTDGDNYFNNLLINVNVNVRTAGTYNLSAYIVDNTGNYISYASKTTSLGTGLQTVQLSFDGSTIYKSRKNGPYTAYIYLYNSNWYWISDATYTTRTYSYTQFQPTLIAVALSPPHSDRLLDNNGDGTTDYLVVDVKANIGRAGKVYVSGSLYGGSALAGNYSSSGYGTYIGYAWREVTLPAGTRTISLYFDSATIKRAGVNGPYTASISIYDENYSSYDYGDYTTSAYTSSQFGQVSTGLNPPHTDNGVDTNGDNLYDYLEIKVKLKVGAAGRYSVNASLSGGASGAYTYIDYAWAESDLQAGAQTITLRFDGSKIRQSRINGPYTVSLYLQKDYNWVDNGTYTTRTYAYSQFQTQAVSLAPPHSDSGSDTNGDGLYDYLVVDVKLNVGRAGVYTVSGSLMGSSSNYDNVYPAAASASGAATAYSGGCIDSAWNDVTLAAGIQTVRLRFNGSRILQSGVNGPYTVSLSVYGPHAQENGAYSYGWETSDYGTYTTGTYSSTQFQPSGAAFSPPHSDSGRDDDGDGKYDSLDVAVRVSVATPGRYRVDGSLMSSADNFAAPGAAAAHGTFIDHAVADVNLSAGTQTVVLSFSGEKIYNSQIDGPYTASISISDSSWNWLGSDTYTTSAYSYASFQSPGISFSSPHMDRGVDTDGDGLYDYLEINVGVDVSSPGTYIVVGEIVSAAYSAAEQTGPPTSAGATIATMARYTPIVAMKQATLGAGVQTVQLRFSGGLIYQLGQNGQYQIRLLIIKSLGEWEPLDEDSYTTTSTYQYTSFEQPLAMFAAPHSDSGLDTDNDGFYNKLSVRANLSVRASTSVRIVGFLVSSSGQVIDRIIKDVSLQAGQQSVTLEFDGWKIYSAHAQGSMTVGLLLLDPSAGEAVWYDMGGIRVPLTGWVDMDTHVTTSYSYLQFQHEAPRFSAFLMGRPLGALLFGQATNVNLSENLPTLRGIVVVATGDNPRVSVTEDNEAPDGVYAPSDNENVVSYITITVENAEGRGLVLRIPKSRLAELGIDNNTLNVYRFEGENWRALTVENIWEDENYIYMQISTPGFSLFAVSGSSAAPPGITPTMPTQPFPAMPPVLLVAVTAIMLIAVILVVIWRYVSLGTKGLSRRK